MMLTSLRLRDTDRDIIRCRRRRGSGGTPRRQQAQVSHWTVLRCAAGSMSPQFARVQANPVRYNRRGRLATAGGRGDRIRRGMSPSGPNSEEAIIIDKVGSLVHSRHAHPR